jgi:hypothetical protein
LVGYTSRMNHDEIDKGIRRSTLKLVGLSLVEGFLIGFGVGAFVMYNSIDRVIVIPLEPSFEV